ncbi:MULTISPECIES: hypothetical protein [unclassified Bradyrhizobium]|uniref:hypothetical protein n=1 Tax=unclassified Bradyrhizobium TaxID=2631580 RepID=UPI002915CE7A|nr:MULTISPECIES: hypothetical protein [unclassified Bradyrhizobium]
MRLRYFGVSLFVTAVVTLSAGGVAAGGCLKDTRRIRVDTANVARLQGYLCTSDTDVQTRVQVQFQRLSGLATGVVLNGGSAPWLPALYGSYQVVDNDVLKEYGTLISRFGSAVREVDQGGGESIYLGLLAGPAAEVTSGKLTETTRARKGQIVRSYTLAPLPDIPLVDETLQILNEKTWPASLNMYYSPEDENTSPLDAISVWRYLTSADATQYAERLRRYNALVTNRSDHERKTLPKSMGLLNYLTANGWPENFLYASVGPSCGSPMDFVVNQYSFEVEVAVIENVSGKPINISQLFGEKSGSNQLRRVVSSPRTTSTEMLPGRPMMLTPRSRLVIPLRLVFASGDPGSLGTANRTENLKQAQESFKKIMVRPPGTVFSTEVFSPLRGNTRAKGDDTYVIRKVRESFRPPSYPIESDFAFGPEWALAGIAIGGEPITFNATPPNVILMTASSEAGSCPILYSWDGHAATWLRHGKVLHEAQTRIHEASETVQFDGLVHRFRIVEEELERATIRQLSLRLDLNDGRVLVLQPEPLPVGRTTQPAELIAALYANDEIEISFALPSDLDTAQVIHSSFTVTGYYDRYAALLVSAKAGSLNR